MGCNGCGGANTTSVTGNIVGTPASNPFAGGPTTLTGAQAAQAASAAPSTSTTQVAAQPTGCNGCGASWLQLLVAAIVGGVVVAVVAKR